MDRDNFDVTVIGGGIVALTTAIACSRHGLTVALVRGEHPGMASIAAAGMLAPSIEPESGAAGTFAFAARDMYPAFVAELEDQTGATIPFDRSGIIEMVAVEDLVRARVTPGATLASPRDLRSLEPDLRFAANAWAVFHDVDGWVDNKTLIRALTRRVQQLSSISVMATEARRVNLAGTGAELQLADGARISGRKTVLACGSWVSGIEGLPRAIPVEPRRGQILCVTGAAQRHVIVGANGYSVPRPDSTALLGSTMEDTGFDASTTAEGIDEIRRAAAEISPTLASARETSRWAGLRPMTPDMLPIIGVDPEHAGIIYACGHSRNGILLGPLTGRCAGALAAGVSPDVDLSPFCVSRFESRGK